MKLDKCKRFFMANIYHIPALLNESIDGLNINPSGVYVDVTFGGGGHSKEILSRLNDKGRLFSFDQDSDAIQNAFDDERFTFIRSNFRYLKNFLSFYGIDSVDGIIADLGVSFHHFDSPERGFSFRSDANLDMRMNTRALKTAKAVLNDYTEDKLADVFYLYGELRNARKIASLIVKARKKQSIDTTTAFTEVLKPLLPREKDNKILAQVYQALRIEVNDELIALEEMLVSGLNVLKPGGRFSVISYHSLEDRMVKNFFRTGNLEGQIVKDFFGNIESPFNLINRKVIVPTEDEQLNNPRSRSAKLRIVEKK